MTPRRLICWKSFWFGILVLGFLGFGWARTMNRVDAVSLGVRSSYWTVRSFSGQVGLDRREDNGETRWIHGVRFESAKGGNNKEWIQPAIERGGANNLRFGLGRFTLWRVAHWFLMLLFLIPWAAFLAWRWQRQRKL